MSRKMKRWIAQRLAGLTLIACGVIPWAITGDGTAALFFVPFGLYMMLTKSDILVK